MLAAPRLAVWAALNDAETLRAAIPGCSKISWTSESELEATITVNLGVVKPTFKGDLILSDIEPAVKYTLAGKGHGGLLGLAHGTAEITLDDHADGTLLVFVANGGASGQVMRLGKAIVGASAQKVIDHFFERFGDAMGASVTPLHED